MHLTLTLAVFALTSIVTVALPHDANYAAIKIIRQQPDTWTFELQTPLQALDNGMRLFNDKQSRNIEDVAAGSVKYKELIVEYVKETGKLETASTMDNQTPTTGPVLGSGKIKLGEHVSVLIFDIENMPQTPELMTLRLPYMADNPGQHNILWLIDGEHRERQVLSENNNFTLLETDFFNTVTSRE